VAVVGWHNGVGLSISVTNPARDNSDRPLSDNHSHFYTEPTPYSWFALADGRNTTFSLNRTTHINVLLLQSASVSRHCQRQPLG
jgi:hypothetical protein